MLKKCDFSLFLCSRINFNYTLHCFVSIFESTAIISSEIMILSEENQIFIYYTTPTYASTINTFLHVLITSDIDVQIVIYSWTLSWWHRFMQNVVSSVRCSVEPNNSSQVTCFSALLNTTYKTHTSRITSLPITLLEHNFPRMRFFREIIHLHFPEKAFSLRIQDKYRHFRPGKWQH